MSGQYAPTGTMSRESKPAETDYLGEWEAVDMTTGEVIAIRHQHRSYLGAAMQLNGDRPEFFTIDPSKRDIRRKAKSNGKR